MNKKIASELAIATVLLIAITIGGIIWLENKKQELLNENKETFSQAEKALAKNDQAPAESATCTPHYYEGETKLRGWLASSQQDSSDTVVQIKSEDVANLPVKNSNDTSNFQVKLVDPSDKTIADLKKATKEKPATIIVRGYAELCKQPPLVSLQQATIAFKKS